MAVYRFRVFIEDDHEVYRDIEVLGRQRFADLHQAIVKAFNFKPGEPAEYVSSDLSWYEGDTVVELDGNLEGDHQKIAAHIFDPHQRFICITESYKQVGLALELQKVLKEEEGAVYPRCVREEGQPPYYTQPPPEPIMDEPEPLEVTGPDTHLFEGDEPSEEEIERLQQEAEKAAKAGLFTPPEVDVSELHKKGKKPGPDKKEEGLGDFNIDDLM